jgi:hypothetical protein
MTTEPPLPKKINRPQYLGFNRTTPLPLPPFPRKRPFAGGGRWCILCAKHIKKRGDLKKVASSPICWRKGQLQPFSASFLIGPVSIQYFSRGDTSHLATRKYVLMVLPAGDMKKICSGGFDFRQKKQKKMKAVCNRNLCCIFANGYDNNYSMLLRTVCIVRFLQYVHYNETHHCNQ